MFKQSQAILRLLRDDDPETVALIKRQLAQNGPETIADLRALLTGCDQRVDLHIREVLAQIERRHARERLEVLCQTPDDHFDLETGCWLLAQVFLPEASLEPYQNQLDQWGLQLQKRLSVSMTDLQRVQVMGQFLGRELGFRGNSDDYYNVRNSLLPCVMDSRLGIPISLSVIYLLVARRAGYILEGINLPGHFVLRHGSVFFDCFYEGQVLSFSECAESVGRHTLRWSPRRIPLAHPKQILTRMLANLFCIFEGGDDKELSALTRRWIELCETEMKR